MILQVDPSSPIPPYEQIRAQVQAMAESGVLAPGTRLPPIRQLAGDLGLAGGTVARAYRELEHEGIVVGRGRHGTVVTARVEAPDPKANQGRLDAAAETFATTARHAGIDVENAVTAVRAAFGRLNHTSQPTHDGVGP